MVRRRFQGVGVIEGDICNPFLLLSFVLPITDNEWWTS